MSAVQRRCPPPCGLTEQHVEEETPRATCRACRREVVDLSANVRAMPPPRDEKPIAKPVRRKGTR